MEDDYLKAIRELAEASTPGTVRGLFRSDDPSDQLAQFKETLDHATGQVWCVCSPFEGKPIEDEALYTAITGNGPTSAANALFYANARKVVLELVDEVERMRPVVNRAIAARQVVWSDDSTAAGVRVVMELHDTIDAYLKPSARVIR